MFLASFPFLAVQDQERGLDCQPLDKEDGNRNQGDGSRLHGFGAASWAEALEGGQERYQWANKKRVVSEGVGCTCRAEYSITAGESHLCAE